MNIVFLKFIKICLIGLLGGTLLILILPIIIPLIIIFYILLNVSFILSKLRHGRSILKPTGMDVVNGKESEISRPYINIVFQFYDAVPSINDFRRRFQENVLDQRDRHGKQIFEKFHKILIKSFGYYVWKDTENFDLTNHINIIDPAQFKAQILEEKRKKNPNLDISSSLKNMNDLTDIKWEEIMECVMREYGARPLEEGLPKWEVLVLPEGEKRFTSIFRYHHSITDGMYFLRLIIECLADEGVEVTIPYMNVGNTTFEKVIKKALSFLFLPYGLYKALSSNDNNPLHGPKLCGKKKFLLSERISLEPMKEVRHATGVTINDIIFSSVSKAVHEHFDRRNYSTEGIKTLLAVNLQKQKMNIILKNDFAVTDITLPISLKKSTQKNQALKNKFNNNNQEHDWSTTPALHRLLVVKESLDEAKFNPSLLSISWLLKFVPYVAPAVISESLLSTEGITIDISNVKGPTSEVSYFGRVSGDTAFWLSDRDPLGIAVSIISYNGHLRMGLTVDESIIKEDEEGRLFLSQCTEEIRNMHKELMNLKRIGENTQTEITPFLIKEIP